MTAKDEDALQKARAEFVDKYRFLLLGLLVEAIKVGAGKSNAEIFLQNVALEKCDAVLGRAFDAAAEFPKPPKPSPQANGVHARRDGVK